MSKKSKELFDRMMQPHLPPMGAVEAVVEGVKEAVKAFAPGLTLKDILQDVGAELKHQAALGAHELAAGLFRGNDALVMYPRHDGQREDPQQGLPPEAQKENDRGMEM